MENAWALVKEKKNRAFIISETQRSFDAFFIFIFYHSCFLGTAGYMHHNTESSIVVYYWYIPYHWLMTGS